MINETKRPEEPLFGFIEWGKSIDDVIQNGMTVEQSRFTDPERTYSIETGEYLSFKGYNVISKSKRDHPVDGNPRTGSEDDLSDCIFAAQDKFNQAVANALNPVFIPSGTNVVVLRGYYNEYRAELEAYYLKG